MIVTAVSILLAAFGVSAFLCAVVRRLAPSLGLIDRPDARKTHKTPVPLGGGVAIWLTVGVLLAVGSVALRILPASLPRVASENAEGAAGRLGEVAILFGLSTAIMILGLLDDKYRLGPVLRLAIQTGLAVVFVLTGDRVTMFQSGGAGVKIAMSVVTVVWIVGLTNSFNFLDNMDGLAASVGLIACLLFATAQYLVGSLFVPALLLVLAGSLGGFLVHNRPPARLYMGDAGSNFLGFMLGTLTVAGTFTRAEFSPYGVITPLLVMAVPLYDTISVIAIRLREGRSPFQADRCHLSHRLVDRGLTPKRAVATIDLITLTGGLGALLLSRLTSPWEAGVIVGQTLCLLGLVAALELSSPKQRESGNGANPSEDRDATISSGGA